jgi:L-histidine Nalpha-methyltransferase
MTAVRLPSSNLRLEISEITSPDPAAFSRDVASAFSAQPKRPLSPKYYYDDLGSALFEAICHLPEYYLTRSEAQILSAHATEIVSALHGALELLELGSGSATKTRFLIDAALRTQGTLRYNAIDISHEAIVHACTSLVDACPRLLVRGYIGDYFDVLDSGTLRLDDKRRVLALCLGSNIGNYAPPEAKRLVAMVSKALRRGDALLIGTDMKKEPDVLERAYNDDAGVMSAFGKNLLLRINRELGASFRLRDFEHVAIYDAQRGCVDSFLQARRTHTVPIPRAGIIARFVDGEMMHTETSYKFDENDFAALIDGTGFREIRTFYDRTRSFALHLLCNS